MPTDHPESSPSLEKLSAVVINVTHEAPALPVSHCWIAIRVSRVEERVPVVKSSNWVRTGSASTLRCSLSYNDRNRLSASCTILLDVDYAN